MRVREINLGTGVLFKDDIKFQGYVALVTC